MIMILQHGEYESAGAIEEYLQEKRLPFEILRLYDGDNIPKVIPERLIGLGGQMSVNDTKDYPYFQDEKNLIIKTIGHGRPLLGICLGAQMIASAFGQTVYPKKEELGWIACMAVNRVPTVSFPNHSVSFTGTMRRLIFQRAQPCFCMVMP